MVYFLKLTRNENDDNIFQKQATVPKTRSTRGGIVSVPWLPGAILLSILLIRSHTWKYHSAPFEAAATAAVVAAVTAAVDVAFSLLAPLPFTVATIHNRISATANNATLFSTTLSPDGRCTGDGVVS